MYIPGGFSIKHNALYFLAYFMHFPYRSSHRVSLQRNCIKMTSFRVNRFSSWRIEKHSLALLASFKHLALSICFVSTTYNELVPNSNKFSFEKESKNEYAAFLYMKKMRKTKTILPSKRHFRFGNFSCGKFIASY